MNAKVKAPAKKPGLHPSQFRALLRFVEERLDQENAAAKGVREELDKSGAGTSPAAAWPFPTFSADGDSGHNSDWVKSLRNEYRRLNDNIRKLTQARNSLRDAQIHLEQFRAS